MLITLDRFRGQNIGVVFQRQHLVKALTVFDNLTLAQYLANLPQDKKRITTVLAQLNLTAQQKALPQTLSQGEAQRTALARAVINRSKILLCMVEVLNWVFDKANTQIKIDS